jgi:hypothetical protein
MFACENLLKDPPFAAGQPRRNLLRRVPTEVKYLAAQDLARPFAAGTINELKVPINGPNLDQPDVADINSGLLADLANDGRLRRFAAIDEAARKSPARIWPQEMLKQKHFPLAIDDDRRGRGREPRLGQPDDPLAGRRRQQFPGSFYQFLYQVPLKSLCYMGLTISEIRGNFRVFAVFL